MDICTSPSLNKSYRKRGRGFKRDFALFVIGRGRRKEWEGGNDIIIFCMGALETLVPGLDTGIFKGSLGNITVELKLRAIALRELTKLFH